MKKIKNIFYIIILLLGVWDNSFAFTISGTVSDYYSPISDALIFDAETNQQVAKSDENGSFSYDTESNEPVKLYAVKTGWIQMNAKQEIAKETTDVSFIMTPWWIKDELKVYTVLEEDENCIINYGLNVENRRNSYANNYERPCLLKCDVELENSFYPTNPETGVFVIKNLIPLMTIGVSQWHGGTIFIDKPEENEFVYRVSREEVEDFIVYESQFYKDKENFKKEFRKELFKFCDKKYLSTTISSDTEASLSEEDSKKKIAELQENYDAMKEKEQSTENKLLGAGAMASIGAGGQMIASSLAEQQADEAAELDMTAYLATFRCDFGQGRNIKGGETDIVLPGGNALAPLYTEYVQLAQDLKIRKEALGMAPGIESEEILDKANMGLYDNESLGKTDGAFTSLASALSNPTGADAAELAAQKAETAEQLKTGAITAGVGAVASIAANIAINENKNAKQEEKESGMNDVKENNKSPDSTCLSKLTIKEEVKQTDYYKKIESFCSVQFPNSSDCAKIILAYFDGHSYVTEDLESHVVTEYSLNFYIKEANTACETYKYAYDSHFIKEK